MQLKQLNLNESIERLLYTVINEQYNFDGVVVDSEDHYSMYFGKECDWKDDNKKNLFSLMKILVGAGNYEIILDGYITLLYGDCHRGLSTIDCEKDLVEWLIRKSIKKDGFVIKLNLINDLDQITDSDERRMIESLKVNIAESMSTIELKNAGGMVELNTDIDKVLEYYQFLDQKNMDFIVKNNLFFNELCGVTDSDTRKKSLESMFQNQNLEFVVNVVLLSQSFEKLLDIVFYTKNLKNIKLFIHESSKYKDI